MGIPEATGDVARLRGQFRQLKACYDACAAAGLAVDTLSMGMSADLELAIAEGATEVRIGTAIFGSARASREGDRCERTFIGGGNMASAIIGGLDRARRRAPRTSASWSRSPTQRERLAARFPGIGIARGSRARAPSPAPTSSCWRSSRSRCATPRVSYRRSSAGCRWC